MREKLSAAPHVKDFAFAPNGEDLIVAAEALNGASTGYALAAIKDYRSADSQQSITLYEFADYRQLPTDIAVSSNSSTLAFTHLDHLYTLDIKENSSLRQITTSRFNEVDVSWSPDDNYLIFAANITDNGDCGAIRIIPSSPKEIIPVPDDGVNNISVDPRQPVDQSGKVIHSCGSATIYWYK